MLAYAQAQRKKVAVYSVVANDRVPTKNDITPGLQHILGYHILPSSLPPLCSAASPQHGIAKASVVKEDFVLPPTKSDLMK